ncbi:MAG: FG-GAP repeat domain-containing protein [Myxococcota bacterium]
MTRLLTSALAAIALVAGGAGSASAQTVDVWDVDHVVFGWDPASGPVAGYFVYVSRNGDPTQLAAVTAGLQASVDGTAGDVVQITVSAYDTAGAEGPASPVSPSVRFNATPPPPPPPPPPPADDPPVDPPADPPPPSGVRPDLDFNGDGTSDLLLRDTNGELAIWNMDGNHVLSQTPVASLPPHWKVVSNGDYDGNGMADVVWQEDLTGRIVVELLDDGSVAGTIDLDLGLLAEDDWLVGGSGDFDGDGIDDLFLFSRPRSESRIVFFGAGGVASDQSLPGYGTHFSVDDVGDFDGDGLDEVVWRDDRRHDLVYWDLDGAGPEGASFVSNSVKGWRLVGSGDFDGNGTDDLFMVRAEPDKVEVWLLDAGAIGGVASLPLPVTPDWDALSIGDHDGDGLSDLAWRRGGSGDVEIWFSNGDSITATSVGASPARTLVSGVQGTEDARVLTRLCNGDFDGDGMVGGPDYARITRCFGKPAQSRCAEPDMDSDGQVTQLDVERFLRVFGRAACVQ